MKVVDLADSVYRDLGQPSSISISSVSYWLLNHIGELNTLIQTSYTVDDNLEIVDEEGEEIGREESDILKQLYSVYWTRLQVKSNLGASATESIISIDDDGASIRRINKTTLASEYRNLAKDEQIVLDKLINAYKMKSSVPRQVVGDDTEPASEGPFDSTDVARIV